MPLLYSNFPPLRTNFKTYPETFKNLLSQADYLRIASGYFSTDSAVDLKGIIEANGGPRIDLCIGMHFFEGMSPVQLDALKSLDEALQAQDLGKVYMVTTFPFHGKISSFHKDNRVIGSIMGSSNLTNIVQGQRQYEADYLFQNDTNSIELSDFVSKLIEVSSKPFNTLDITPTIPENNLLNEQVGVKKINPNDLQEAQHTLTELTFDIPLKGDEAQRSGLNASFGEGRRNPQGFVIPRPWYEVELIVPKSITTLPGYPQAESGGDSGSFCAVTDDGWEFRCKVSGDYSKNFRSEDDLKILGKWIKGRLENAGVLRPGQRVSDDTLVKYGRSNISLTKLKDTDKWFLDFGVNR
jgi:hypothetical protein